MSKEGFQQKGTIERFGNFNLKLGVALMAVGVLASELLLTYGAFNVAQGWGMEKLAKKWRERKAPKMKM